MRWTDELKEKYLDKLRPNSFYIPFLDYLKWFKGTSVNVDHVKRAHYRIKSIGTDMKDKKDMFLTFYLDQEIDCSKDEFAVVCEQQGDRIQNYHKPKDSGV